MARRKPCNGHMLAELKLMKPSLVSRDFREDGKIIMSNHEAGLSTCDRITPTKSESKLVLDIPWQKDPNHFFNLLVVGKE